MSFLLRQRLGTAINAGHCTSKVLPSDVFLKHHSQPCLSPALNLSLLSLVRIWTPCVPKINFRSLAYKAFFSIWLQLTSPDSSFLGPPTLTPFSGPPVLSSR